VVDSTLRSAVASALGDLRDDLNSLGAPWIDNDGQAVTDVLPNPRVQMRQLHRKRKKPAA